MIDINKYEGHTPAPWKNFNVIDKETNDKFVQRGLYREIELMHDAPLLLAEVLRLREENKILNSQLTATRKWIQEQERTLKVMAARADYMACSADKVDEWHRIDAEGVLG